MRPILGAAVAAAAIIASGAAFASTLPAISDKSDFAPGADPYQGIYNASNAAAHHGFWLPNLASGVSRYWSIDSGSTMTYDQSNTGAELVFTGTISSKNTDLQLEFYIEFEENDHDVGGGPKCQGNNCANNLTAEQIANGRYFSFTSTAHLMGIAGNDTEGLSWSLTEKPEGGEHPPQFGYGMDWFSDGDNTNEEPFAFATWLFFNLDGDSNVTQNGYTFYDGKKHGDINLHLAPVPVPAALPLLMAGLGVLGLARRRQRTS